MEEKLQEIINDLKSITEKYMLGNYPQLNNFKKVLAEDIKELEKALEEFETLEYSYKRLVEICAEQDKCIKDMAGKNLNLQEQLNAL